MRKQMQMSERKLPRQLPSAGQSPGSSDSARPVWRRQTPAQSLPAQGRCRLRPQIHLLPRLGVYEWAHHANTAYELGVCEGEVRTITDEKSALCSARICVLLQATDDLIACYKEGRRDLDKTLPRTLGRSCRRISHSHWPCLDISRCRICSSKPRSRYINDGMQRPDKPKQTAMATVSNWGGAHCPTVSTVSRPAKTLD